jgi:hypothetical protein
MSRNAQRKAAVNDKNDPAYWKLIKGGDFVGIRDAEAFAQELADAGAHGNAAGPISVSDYTAGEIRIFALQGRESSRTGPRASLGAASPGEYRFIELLKEGALSFYLTLVEAEGRSELRLYFIPEGLACGTRDELIDRGETWLFLPPPKPDDFKSSELEYAPYPDVPEIQEGGESRKLLFAPSLSGKSLYGEAQDTLAAVIITEYAAQIQEGDAAPDNPLLLVLEEGWILSDGSQPEEGGYLTPMLGRVLDGANVDYYPSS